MTSPPDKLFRDGLEHYHKPAPPSAWDRIESGLDRKRNRFPWIKIAAGLFLVIAAWALLRQPDQTDQIVDTENTKTSVTTMKPDTLTAIETEPQEIGGKSQESSPTEAEITPVAGHSQLKDLKPQSPVYSLQSPVSSQSSDITPDKSSETTMIEPDEKIAEPYPQIQVEAVDEISTNDIVNAQKGINVTYSAKEVNAKYLKQEQAPDATPEKKNTSGLQKVIDRALDLKNEESVLADLREKKNEWLSLNIPSKQRETNK